MAIPDYQTLMLPIARMTGDGQDHRISDLVEALCAEFRLTEEDLDQRFAARACSSQRHASRATHESTSVGSANGSS